MNREWVKHLNVGALTFVFLLLASSVASSESVLTATTSTSLATNAPSELVLTEEIIKEEQKWEKETAKEEEEETLRRQKVGLTSNVTVKPVFSGHSKIDKIQSLMTNVSLMKVKSIAECSPWSRAVEIPCPTCPTWSHFIQDKLKISLYLSLDKHKICIS